MNRREFMMMGAAGAVLAGTKAGFAADGLEPPKIKRNAPPRNRRPYKNLDWSKVTRVKTTSHGHCTSQQMLDVYDQLRGDGPYSVAEPLKILDLGTGGGFPGIPLAVIFPHADFTLCDSIGKKIIVATEVSKGLGLKNVKTVNARAESLPETFDYIVSRAVTSLENFMPWVKGKYNDGILYLKGGDLAEELAATHRRWTLYDISEWFEDEFFETKRVVYTRRD